MGRGKTKKKSKGREIATKNSTSGSRVSGTTGLWQPSVHNDDAFFDIGFFIRRRGKKNAKKKKTLDDSRM
jgi:hypothetical protein